VAGNRETPFAATMAVNSGLLTSSARKALIREEFVHNFAYQLQKAKLTQKELCEMSRDQAAGDSVLTPIKEWDISRYARGEITPKPFRIEQMANLLKISPYDLVPSFEKPTVASGSKMVIEDIGEGKAHVEFSAVIDMDVAKQVMGLLLTSKN